MLLQHMKLVFNSQLLTQIKLCSVKNMCFWDFLLTVPYKESIRKRINVSKVLSSYKTWLVENYPDILTLLSLISKFVLCFLPLVLDLLNIYLMKKIYLGFFLSCVICISSLLRMRFFNSLIGWLVKVALNLAWIDCLQYQWDDIVHR